MEEMDPLEYLLWQRYYELEPFGPWGEYYRAATLGAITFNSQAEKGKGIKLTDVFPTVFRETEADRLRTTEESAKALKFGAVKMEETGEELKKRLRETVGR